MNDALKYAEEPTYLIMRESLINFCKKQTVAKRLNPDKKYIVFNIYNKMIRICIGDVCENVHYSELMTFDYPFVSISSASSGWNVSEINYLKENISTPNSKIARILGRTEKAVCAKKCQIKKSLNYEN